MNTFYIETVGCQMNVLDSELVASGLLRLGLTPAESLRDADVILFNTCSIRQHAEDKVYSALGRLKPWKERNPHGVLGVLGCMAQKDQRLIFRRAPHVDFVLGPGQLEQISGVVKTLLDDKADGRIPNKELLVSLPRRERKHADVVESFKLFDPIRLPETRPRRFQALVRIMFGCDKFCSYCIVPSVRGPEQSRPPQEILDEAKSLVDQGVLEITLIGQTVNSYRFTEGEKTTRLSDLLSQICELDGLRRVRFVTNYPRGMDDALLQAVRDLPKVGKHLHVPAQSGSDAVLKRMKRHYTVSEYRELVDRIYGTIPGASMTSDFIVGFCGETEEEFAETVDLVKYGRFKNSFIFKYSERQGTKSAELFADDVPESIKKRRNNELLAVQDSISLESNRRFIGKTVEILVEGPAVQASWNFRSEENDPLPLVAGLTERNDVDEKKRSLFHRLTGRTPCDRVVVFDGEPSSIGSLIELEIVDAAPFTLAGVRTVNR